MYLDDRKRSEPQRGSVGGTPKQETIDEPEFEIVEKPADTAQTDTGQILAVTPAAAVLPFLQNLLSPFVMGLTKSARAVSFCIASAHITGRIHYRRDCSTDNTSWNLVQSVYPHICSFA